MRHALLLSCICALAVGLAGCDMGSKSMDNGQGQSVSGGYDPAGVMVMLDGQKVEGEDAVAIAPTPTIEVVTNMDAIGAFNRVELTIHPVDDGEVESEMTYTTEAAARMAEGRQVELKDFTFINGDIKTGLDALPAGTYLFDVRAVGSEGWAGQKIKATVQ
jgi:hypothetical protein